MRTLGTVSRLIWGHSTLCVHVTVAWTHALKLSALYCMEVGHKMLATLIACMVVYYAVYDWCWLVTLVTVWADDRGETIRGHILHICNLSTHPALEKYITGTHTQHTHAHTHTHACTHTHAHTHTHMHAHTRTHTHNTHTHTHKHTHTPQRRHSEVLAVWSASLIAFLSTSWAGRAGGQSTPP